MFFYRNVDYEIVQILGEKKEACETKFPESYDANCKEVTEMYKQAENAYHVKCLFIYCLLI